MPAITDLPIRKDTGYEIYSQGTATTTPATYTYPGTMTNYIFRNDGSVNATLTVNGVATTVASGDCAIGTSMSSFTITASSGTISWTMRAYDLIATPINGSFSITPSGTQTVNNDVIAVTMQNAATAIGNGTTLNTTNQAMAVLDVQGTFVGTITVEATIDGTNYFAIKTTDMSSDTRVATITSIGQFSLRTAGYQNVRARISAYTSGSITVYGRAVAGGVTHHTSSITNTPTFNQGGVDQTAFRTISYTFSASATGDSTPIDVTNYETLGFYVAFSATGSVSLFVSTDGTNYNNIQYTADGGSRGTGITSAGTYRYSISGFRFIKFNASVNTGTITITGNCEVTKYVSPYPSTISGSSDGQSSSAVLLNTGSYLLGFNGTTWDRLQVDTSKNLKVNLASMITPNADSVGAGGVSNSIGAYGMLYNGSTFDRARNHQAASSALASGARTSTTSSADLINYNYKGIAVKLNVTVASGTGGLQMRIMSKESVSGNYIACNSLPTAITATGTYQILMYTGCDATNSALTQVINQCPAKTVRLDVVHGDASSYTYSLTYEWLV